MKLLKATILIIFFGTVGANISAQTSISGNITTNTTWTTAGSPYTVTDTVTVDNGVTLTIEQGVSIEFNSGASLFIDGALNAEGTESSKITFTSSESIKSAGDWGTIRFNNTSNVGSTLIHLIIEYGGGAGTGAMITYRTGALGVDLRNSELRFSELHGIDLRASSPTIFKTTIRDNTGYGVFSDLALNFRVDSSSVLRNTQGGIRVPINASSKITASTIDENGTGIYVDNGAIPEIRFNDITNNSLGIRIIETSGLSPVISDNTISGNLNFGIRNDGSGEVIADYNFWGDKFGPVNFSNPSGTGDEVSNNIDFTPWLFGETLPVREITANPADGDIWSADSVYYLQNTISVGLSVTLTIQPGAVVKFADGASLTVSGTLIANGTSTDRIYFTSQYDDAIGGDSNNDMRATQPDRGDWNSLYIGSSTTNSVLNNIDLRYGGSSSSGMLHLISSDINVTNIQATNSGYHGIFVDNKPTAFNHITANSNDNDGIYVQAGGVELQNITTSFNDDDGLTVELSDLTEDITIDSLTSVGNGDYGVYFNDGGTGRNFGLASLTNSQISDNGFTGLEVHENDVDQISISNNTFSGNGDFGASLYLTKADSNSVEIFDNTFSDNGLSGIKTTAAQIHNNTFSGNEFGISLWGKLGHRYTDENGVDGNTFTGNTYNNVVGLEGFLLKGTLSATLPEAITSGAYMFQRVSYLSPDRQAFGVAVVADDTLTIAPGVIVKAWDGRYRDGAFEIFDGMIVAEGTESNPIIFTSWRDDSAGGDTDAVDDTVSAKPNDWGGIFINDVSRDNNGISKHSRLSHVQIKYANIGLSMEVGNQLFADEIDHLTITDSHNRGMKLEYGRYTITNALIENTQLFQGIFANRGADVTVRNSIIRNNGSDGLVASGNNGSFFREVSNSTIEGNSANGVNTENLGSASTLLGNTIQNNAQNGVSYHHNDLDSTDVFFTGNILRNNGESGIRSSAANFVDNAFEGNEFGISLWGKLGHRYTDENGVDGNTFTGNTYNNVVGLEGFLLKGTLSATLPEAITSGAYMFQRVSYLSPDRQAFGVAVVADDTLTIAPGVIVKAWDGRYRDGAFEIFDGMIVAEGTESNPIIFTSWRDDSAGGDTDAVDDTVSAKPNDWGGIFINDVSRDNNGISKHSRLSHVQIKYANIGLSMEVGNQLFADEIDHLTITDSHNRGMELEYGRYTITNALIENTQLYDGIWASRNADVTVRNSIIRNNGSDGLVASGNNGSFFREVSNSTIENNNKSGLFVNDAKSPMTFQNNVISNNEHYGIFANVTEATTDTVLTIAGNRIENNKLVGIASSRAIILNDTLTGNYYPIATTGELSKNGTINENGNFYEDNIIHSNKIDSVTALFGKINGKLGFNNPYGTTNSVMVTDNDRLPRFSDNRGSQTVYTQSGDSLIVNAGTVVKNSGISTIYMEGTFLSEGEINSKIVFTSINDDTYAGNTNRDTTNILPKSRDWSGITLHDAGSDSSRVKNTIIRYANSALSINNSDALIDSSAFSNSRYGIFFSRGSNSTIRLSEIHSNDFDGVHIDNNSDNNPVFQLNNFYGNGRSGLINRSPNTILAENNYWDDATGPLVDKGSDQNLGGLGEYINVDNGAVDYRPFLTGRNGILLGDVTENGTISAFDASTVLQHIVGATTLAGNALAAADVTANGTVSAMDASFILQFVVGNITGFPGQGKKLPIDMTEAFELTIVSDSDHSELELTNTGITFISATEIEFVVPNNPINEVELVPSVFSENLSMNYRIDKDTVMIAIAGNKAMNEKGVFAKLRFAYADNGEGRDLRENIFYNKFILNETDLTDHMNEVQTGIKDDLADIPLEFKLNQNYPNPFNPSTNITYDLPAKGQVKIEIYNIIGQLVQTLVDAPQQAGSYQMQWDASAFGSGTYLLRINYKGENNQTYSQIRKMLLIK